MSKLQIEKDKKEEQRNMYNFSLRSFRKGDGEGRLPDNSLR